MPAAGQPSRASAGGCCSQTRLHAGSRLEGLECVDTMFGCVAVGWRGCAAVFPYGHALRVRQLHARASVPDFALDAACAQRHRHASE